MLLERLFEQLQTTRNHCIMCAFAALINFMATTVTWTGERASNRYESMPRANPIFPLRIETHITLALHKANALLMNYSGKLLLRVALPSWDPSFCFRQIYFAVEFSDSLACCHATSRRCKGSHGCLGLRVSDSLAWFRTTSGECKEPKGCLAIILLQQIVTI